MQSKFTSGSIFQHVSIMTFASMAGLMSLFLVDLVDMYWLSLLGEIAIAAAIGYAGSILFFTLSLCIGLSIGCSALVSKAVGQGVGREVNYLIGNVFFVIALLTTPVAIIVMLNLSLLLRWMGATGDAHDLAFDYMVIILPSLPVLAVAMASSGVMRAVGHAKVAMYITFVGGGVNALLDPLFIFGFGMGIKGAAVATFVSRLAMVGYGLYLILYRYELIRLPRFDRLKADAKEYFYVALPAALTNLSSPIGVVFVTATMAQFGDSAVAGHAILSKIQPLAFAGLFALSGSVGPIAGQNLGACKFDRIMETLHASIKFIALYCICACAVLALMAPVFVAMFQAEGASKELIYAFCYGLSVIFVFNGITFSTNALFNNINKATWATVLNFLKATVFTMPFVMVGARYGAIGVYVGLLLGAVLVAILGWFVAYRAIATISSSHQT